jgi:hypothetical protein
MSLIIFPILKIFVIEDFLVLLIYYIITIVNTMATITKKQASIAILAVVFATAMITSVIATADNAFANRGHHYKHHHGHHNHGNNHHGDNGSRDNGKSNSQSIGQSNVQNQKSTVVTAGANSPVLNSGNNAAVATNTNNGGNAAAF